MDIDAMLDTILNFGESGVGLAQLITMLFPASWWASGVLYVVKLLLQALSGGVAL